MADLASLTADDFAAHSGSRYLLRLEERALDAAHAALSGIPHQPLIEIRADWYY